MQKKVKFLFGVDVQDYNIVELTKESFKGIDLTKYPAEKAHFLVYALQFQLKPPSIQTMKKSQKMNAKRISKRAGTTKDVTKVKEVTQKKNKAKRVISIRGAKRAQNLPNPLLRANQTPKKQLPPLFVVKSPQEIALKSARKICLDMLQSKWREQLQAQYKNKPKNKPLYFIKKKANQVRRRKELSDIISQNKERLHALYGRNMRSQIAQKSRAQLRKILNIEKKQTPLAALNDDDFPSLYDQDNQNDVGDMLYRLSKKK